MKKVIIIAVLALNAVCLSYLAFSENSQTFNINSAIAEEGQTKYECKDKFYEIRIEINCEDDEGNHHTESWISFYEIVCKPDIGGSEDTDLSCDNWAALDPCTGLTDGGGDC